MLEYFAKKSDIDEETNKYDKKMAKKIEKKRALKKRIGRVDRKILDTIGKEWVRKRRKTRKGKEDNENRETKQNE